MLKPPACNIVSFMRYKGIMNYICLEQCFFNCHFQWHLTLIVPRAWDIGYMHPCIKCQGKAAYHFVYFWSLKSFPYTHLEATSYIPQQGQSLHIWTTSQSTTGCYKNKYTIQFLWLACISRFATAISSSETELALGTIRFIYFRIGTSHLKVNNPGQQ